MSNDLNSQQKSDNSRIFSAKYAHKGWGWTLIVLGVILVIPTETKVAPSAYIFSILMILLGVYFIRGKELSPAQQEKKRKKADLFETNLESAIATLQTSTGGAAVVAYRNLDSIVKKQHKADAITKLDEILTSIEFDSSRIQSVSIGNVRTFSRDSVEVFQDWIVYGQDSYDVDASTRGEVHLDGSIGVDGKGNQKDFRTAELQFVSTNWSMTARINPNDTNDARRIVSQLAIITDALKPSAATTADISAMVQAILTNTGQPPAQRIEQLSALRYQHLLSDEEFEAAKTKVLGI
jgi:hypothetical protein